jgi:hypothetical protein
MFEHLVTSLGRWVGLGQPAAADSSKPDERRVWVRYPCDLEAASQLVNGHQQPHLSARVRDISRGGVQLVLPCRCEVGSLVSVDLPRPLAEAGATVLACVVRVSELPGGEWSVGCTFASELTDEDLQPFGAKRLRPPPSDKRTWVRFPCRTQASFFLVRDPEEKERSAQVVDVSTSGVGLRVSQPVVVGGLLSVDLHGPQGPEGVIMLASVVRVTPGPESDWTLGCNFIRELSDEELKGVL